MWAALENIAHLLDVALKAVDADEGEVVLGQTIVLQRGIHLCPALQILCPPPPQGPAGRHREKSGVSRPRQGAQSAPPHPVWVPALVLHLVDVERQGLQVL